MPPPPLARRKLLDAAIDAFRAGGFSATSVDDLCAAAGVTKGAFFHHFDSKEALAVAATRRWSEVTDGLFDRADYRRIEDPLDRLLAYLAFRRALLRAGDLAHVTCLLGTLAQETFASHPAIRAACGAGIVHHACDVEADVAAAKQRYAPHAAFSPREIALFTQATLQGAFVLAKAQGDVAVAEACVDHLIAYVRSLFAGGRNEGGAS